MKPVPLVLPPTLVEPFVSLAQLSVKLAVLLESVLSATILIRNLTLLETLASTAREPTALTAMFQEIVLPTLHVQEQWNDPISSEPSAGDAIFRDAITASSPINALDALCPLTKPTWPKPAASTARLPTVQHAQMTECAKLALTV